MAAADAAVALVLAFAVQDAGGPAEAVPSAPKPRPRAPGRFVLPTTPGSYTGLYPNGVPDSYAGVTAFTTATGVKPGVVLYYSGWREPFRARFATTVADHSAVPLVQIDPTDVSLAAVSSGKYDGYLSAAAPAAGQPAKIADLFAGIHLYGLLRFVWFDSIHIEDGASTAPQPSSRSGGALRATTGLGHE
jgi:hypothetical protein